MRVRSLGWEDPLEEEMVTHSSILVWRIPLTEEPCGLQSVGSQRVRHDRRDLTHNTERVNIYQISKEGMTLNLETIDVLRGKV